MYKNFLIFIICLIISLIDLSLSFKVPINIVPTTTNNEQEQQPIIIQQIQFYIDCNSKIEYQNFECGLNITNLINGTIPPPCINFYDSGNRIRQFIKITTNTTNLYTLNIIISDGGYYSGTKIGFGNIFGFNGININSNGNSGITIDGKEFDQPFIEILELTPTPKNKSIQYNYNIINNMNFINWQQNIINLNSNGSIINVGIANSKFINIKNSNVLIATNINTILINQCLFIDIHYDYGGHVSNNGNGNGNIISLEQPVIGGNAPIRLIDSNLDWNESNVFNSTSTTPFILLESGSSKLYGGNINNVTVSNGFILNLNCMDSSITNITFSNNNNTMGSLIEYIENGLNGHNYGSFKLMDCTFLENENRESSLISVESSKVISFKTKDTIENCLFSGNIIPKQRSVLYFKERNVYANHVSIKSNSALEVVHSTIGIANSEFLSKQPIIGSNSTLLLYNSDQFNVNSTFTLCKQCNITYLNTGSYNSDSNSNGNSDSHSDYSSHSSHSSSLSSSGEIPTHQPSSSTDLSSDSSKDSSASNDNFSYSSSENESQQAMSSNSFTSSEEKSNERKLSNAFIALIVIVSTFLLAIPIYLTFKYIRDRKDRKLFTNQDDDDYVYVNPNTINDDDDDDDHPLLY